MKGYTTGFVIPAGELRDPYAPPRIPAWVNVRIKELESKEPPRGIHYESITRSAFATYIMAHEQEPVDPDIAAVKRILTEWHGGSDINGECKSFIAAVIQYKEEKAKA